MIKNTLIIISLLITNFIFAQNKSREEMLQLVADDTCECIKNDPQTFSKEVTASKKEVALGLCIFNSFEKRKKSSKAFKDTKTMDQIELIAEEVGMLMITTCGSDFLAAFSADELTEAIEESEIDENIPPPPSPKNHNDFQMEAKLVSVHNDGISFIKVVDDFNKEHIFLIINQFEGKDLIKQSNKNTNIKVYYKEGDFYDLSEQRYVKKKVVNYIETVN